MGGMSTSDILVRVQGLIDRYGDATATQTLLRFFGCCESAEAENAVKEIAAYCEESISHIGIVVPDIDVVAETLAYMPQQFSLQKPIISSVSIPRRYPGSKGKIAFVADKNGNTHFELFEVAWAGSVGEIERKKRECLIEHIALEVLHARSVKKIARIITNSMKSTHVELPAMKNNSDGSTFFYIQNNSGERLEFVFYARAHDIARE